MRRLTFFLSLTCLLIFLCSDMSVNAQGVYSQNMFSETSYDYKGIPRYTMPKHSFIFTNNAKEDLHLVAVRTSCQCTKAYIPEKRLYRTGERGEVVAQIDAVRFTGVRHATVTVTFERAGRTFEVPLNITGVVLENVRLEPQKLNFVVDEANGQNEQTAAAKLGRSQQAYVVYPSNESVLRAESSNPYVEVKVGQAARSGASVKTPLTVSIKEGAPAGYVNAVVRIWSNGANSSQPLSLNVSGVVRAPLSVSPSTLTFFTSQNGEKLVKNIVVSASNEFTLKTVECESKAIECNLPQKSIRPAKVCVVPISFDPSKLQNESASTKLKIETTDGRVLFLSTQISSGNFDSAGLIQTDRDVELVEEETSESVDTEVEVAQSSQPKVSTSTEGIAVSKAKPNPLNSTGMTTNNPTTAQRSNYQRPNQTRPYYESQPTAPFALPFSPRGFFQ